MGKPTHNIVATLGEYTAADGSTKKIYKTCGSMFTEADGRMSIKMDLMPVSKEWSGWFSLYPVDQESRSKSPARSSGSATNDHVEPADDDDIQF